MTGRRRTLRRIGRRADATEPRGPDRHTPDALTPARTDVDVSRVRAILALGGVPWGDLDDGVQEVRLKLLEQRADPARAAVRDTSAWSSVVASRVAADWHRAGARDDGLRARLAARWARQPVVEHTEEDRTTALAVADGLGSLPPHQRQVLTLRYYADLPVRDIARVLGVPEGTVKSRLHTAVAALRTRLRETEVILGDRTDRD
ncbi:sigma-70 family RNA polymerase sigma factor [Streptomyces antimycoticus]|uniref:sigma-70 family RNA polymerase sigma factor n=1 Tax=Streptomyces antimycoticus TaxID=68175 RepID=UPI0025711F6D|nr:sigma-70 family RNA polymerase sigma factor [Streptomyces antimycoticus]WJD95016.1 sigma-70 family RNA polymerase sigma factor [Streptomyces antimycoticus]